MQASTCTCKTRVDFCLSACLLVCRSIYLLSSFCLSVYLSFMVCSDAHRLPIDRALEHARFQSNAKYLCNTHTHTHTHTHAHTHTYTHIFALCVCVCVCVCACVCVCLCVWMCVCAFPFTNAIDLDAPRQRRSLPKPHRETPAP